MVSSIESPFTLLQKPVKISTFYPVKSAHMTLGLVPEVLDPIDVILLISKQLRVVDTYMPQTRKHLGHCKTEMYRYTRYYQGVHALG